MKKVFFILHACLVLLCMAPQVYANNQLVTYPAPEGARLKNDFTVKVRQPGKQWQPLDTYILEVKKVGEAVEFEVKETSMSYFDFSGEVEVSVTFNRGPVESARVRPLSYEITPEVDGNTLTFKLDRPRNLSVEVNGDIFNNLHLFANPIEEYKPNLKDKNLIYYGPGIHRPDGEEIKIPSGKTLYLAGGAVLVARVVVEDAHDVKILGRGKVDHVQWGGIKISNSKNVLVEGVITSQCATGGSNNVTIRNVKAISYTQWGDGMNVFASNNVLFDGVFCRNSDDCTTVYATRLGFHGGCKNITMQNSTLWADVAHPIFIGIHGNADDPEIIEDLNYINIDILDHKERQLDYQGCLAINAGDNNLIRNVRFENIRIEDFRQGQILNVRIYFNEKYCPAPGRGIENVLFKDISYTGKNAEIGIIAGYNEERKVKNIRFENLKINGKVIWDDMPDKPKWYKTGDMARIFVGEHVEDIRFDK